MTAAADDAPPPSPPPPSSSTMRRDVLSAYAASGAKVLSWVIVSAIVFRAGAFHYAVLVLIRGTLGLLNYTTVGLLPALSRLLVEAAAPKPPKPVLPMAEPEPGGVLSYATPAKEDDKQAAWHDPLRVAYSTGLAVARGAGLFGLLLVVIYTGGVDEFHAVPHEVGDVGWVVWWMGLGYVLRLVSEAPAAAIQTRGSIATDNKLQVICELAWIVFALLGLGTRRVDDLLIFAALGYAASGLVLYLARGDEAAGLIGLKRPDYRLVTPRGVRRLLGLGLMVSLAQVADFLYAPTDYILINRLISPGAVAHYGPAVQIDAALLLVVGAIASVLLPKAAIAHTAGDHAALRRYFVRGTLASAALLAAAGVAVYLLSPWIFRIWLGDELPETRAILPLVLVHTIVGGSSGVGRSILLGMGKVKPFAVAALVAGVVNVVLSYGFVKFFDLGLRGIVLGTIVAVVGRCVLWQPWYVMRTLKREAEAAEQAGEPATPVVPPPPPEPL